MHVIRWGASPIIESLSEAEKGLLSRFFAGRELLTPVTAHEIRRGFYALKAQYESASGTTKEAAIYFYLANGESYSEYFNACTRLRFGGSIN